MSCAIACKRAAGLGRGSGQPGGLFEDGAGVFVFTHAETALGSGAVGFGWLPCLFGNPLADFEEFQAGLFGQVGAVESVAKPVRLAGWQARLPPAGQECLPVRGRRLPAGSAAFRYRRNVGWHSGLRQSPAPPAAGVTACRGFAAQHWHCHAVIG